MQKRETIILTKLENLLDACYTLSANLSDADQDKNDEGEVYEDIARLREEMLSAEMLLKKLGERIN